MNSTDLEEAKRIFDEVAGLPADHRHRLIERACAGKPSVRAHVERMIAEFDRGATGSNVNLETIPLDGTSSSTALFTGSIVGVYRLLRKLGSGGMGEVWLAEQSRPVRRNVALKLIKPGMDSAEVIARFEAERQALALMSHLAIAAVLDGGATPDNRPYFAMEYVRGEPITTYCDRHRLGLQARLALFIQVCEGVQHAHQKGIIHRDLKPSNVLVTVVDNHAVPKIIDFGLAKALAQPLTEKTLFTELGVMMGTPEYMSPEQAEMGALDIDTRTDVYALGVMLYELLTGALPFEKAELRRAGVDGIRRMIRESEPPRPSARAAKLGPESTLVAQNRSTDCRSLARLLRGDLDWIVMKSLEKDRTQRYSTVSDLIAELHRYIRFQPVLAGPPSALYRTRKFVRRHRIGVTAGTMVALMLIALGIAIWVQNARVAAERDVAARARDRAERVSAFLASLFEASDPDMARGRSLTAAELLDAGRARLQSELKDEPQTRAALLQTIGRVYRILGRTGEAESALNEALAARQSLSGSQRAELADTLHELAIIYSSRGEIDRSNEVDRQVIQLRQSVFGPDHILVARTLGNLGNNAVAKGQLDEAARYYGQARDMAKRVGSNQDAARMELALAGLLLREDRTADAIDILRPAVEVLQQTTGVENSTTLTAMNNLALALSRVSRYNEAETMQRRILDVRRKMLGPDHYLTAVALYNLGVTLDRTGRSADGVQLLQESVAGHRKARLGPHEQLAYALNALGDALLNQGQLDEAERAYRESLDTFEHFPGSRSDTGWPLNGLGKLYHARRQLAKAEDFFRRALKVRTEVKTTPFQVESSEIGLGRVLCDRGPSEEGESLVRGVLEKHKNEQNWETDQLEGFLGRCLASARRFDEAEPMLTKVYDRLSQSRGPATAETREVAGTLAEMYDSWGKTLPAAEWRKKALPTAGR